MRTHEIPQEWTQMHARIHTHDFKGDDTQAKVFIETKVSV